MISIGKDLREKILMAHKAQHKEEDFKCNFCGKRFKLRNQLTKHMITHGDDVTTDNAKMSNVKTDNIKMSDVTTDVNMDDATTEDALSLSCVTDIWWKC